MAFSKSSQHVVEVTVIYAELILEMLFEFIYRHAFWCFLHFFEDLLKIIVILWRLTVSCMIMGIVKEDKLEFFGAIILFHILQFLLMTTRYAFSIHIRSRSSLKAISMRLYRQPMFPIFFSNKIPEMILIINKLKHLSILREE